MNVKTCDHTIAADANKAKPHANCGIQQLVRFTLDRLTAIWCNFRFGKDTIVRMSIFSPIKDKRWLTYALILVDAALLAWLLSYLYTNFWQQTPITHTAHQISTPTVAYHRTDKAVLSLPNDQMAKAPVLTTHTINTQIASNGSLSQVFHNNGLSKAELTRLMQLQLAAEYLRVVQPDQPLSLTIDSQHHLCGLTAPLAGGRKLIVDSDHGDLQARIQAPHYSKTLEFATATIHQSLSHAAYEAGVPSRLTHKLTEIFGQKINFNKDIRPGDQFSVLYEANYHDGVRVSEGPIVAAEFINHGESHKAIRFDFPDGHSDYYNPNGKSLKRLFLKAPLHYSRISSFFSYHRMDPIIHKIQAHLGVDFAAPRGTAVHSVSDGKVVFVGRRGGYGNAVVVQYGPHYKSLYGHLSRFAKHLHRGQKVSQGQVIAYVGSTGWSTGPHLHYSIYVDGIAKNPLTVKLPTGSSLASRFLDEFKLKSQSLFAQIDLHKGPMLASNESYSS